MVPRQGPTEVTTEFEVAQRREQILASFAENGPPRSSPRFEGYSYRTSSRFGGHVEVTVEDDRVLVTGQRVPPLWRDVWIATQGVLMAVAIGSLLRAVTKRGEARRRALSRSGWSWWIEYIVAAFGALIIWWPADRGRNGAIWTVAPGDRERGEAAARAGYSAMSFPLSAVACVAQTRWYWRRGLWLVAWPWQLLLLLSPDKRTEVVFDVADPAAPGRTLVFALNMATAEQAAELTALLGG